MASVQFPDCFYRSTSGHRPRREDVVRHSTGRLRTRMSLAFSDVFFFFLKEMCSGDSASDFFFSRRYNAPNGMCTRILLRQRLLPLPPGALNTSLVVTSRIGRLPAMTRGRYDRVH